MRLSKKDSNWIAPSISTCNVNSSAKVCCIINMKKKAVEFIFLSCINLSFLANNLFFGNQLAKTSTSDRLLEIRNFSFPQVTKVCSSFWIEAILVCQTCSKEQWWYHKLVERYGINSLMPLLLKSNLFKSTQVWISCIHE